MRAAYATDGISAPAAHDERITALALSLGHAVDQKGRYRPAHSAPVSWLSSLIARQLHFSPEHIEQIELAAMLHDVGKLMTPDAILLKPAGLTRYEYDVIKDHPCVGEQTLLAMGLIDQAHWVRHHHEHVDGSGYPNGLSGDRIPIESRLILVADAFQCICADRAYQAAKLPADALAVLDACAETQFDPDCVAALKAGLGATARSDVALAS